MKMHKSLQKIDSVVFSDYILMNEKNSELEKLNSNLEEYYDNWTKLSEEQE